MSKKHKIEFDGIRELLIKVEQIKNFIIQQSNESRERLTSAGIKFEPIDEYGVSIEVDELGEVGMAILKERTGEFDKFMEELGL